MLGTGRPGRLNGENPSNQRMILRLSFLALPLVLMAQQGALPPDKTSPSLAPSPQPAFAEKIHISGLSDAGKVNDFLYRGTQPNSEGVEALHKLGVDTIVDLRGEFRGTME